jgi:hypothetical protein
MGKLVSENEEVGEESDFVKSWAARAEIPHRSTIYFLNFVVCAKFLVTLYTGA